MHALVVAASLVVCSSGYAQFRPPYHRGSAHLQAQSSIAGQQEPHPHAAGASSGQTAKPAAAPEHAAAPARTPPSLLNKPAQPAKVKLEAGKLTINAHNSALSEILNQVSQSGGMKISGLKAGEANQRIFGTYGPDTPRRVLSDLLTDSGYNVLMLGATPSGLPRRLTLSVRPAGGIPNSPPVSEAKMRQEYEEDQIRPTRYAPQLRPDTRPPQPRQGARPGVRTPQQILQELEQLRQQRQQQQQNQQPN